MQKEKGEIEVNVMIGTSGKYRVEYWEFQGPGFGWKQVTPEGASDRPSLFQKIHAKSELRLVRLLEMAEVRKEKLLDIIEVMAKHCPLEIQEIVKDIKTEN